MIKFTDDVKSNYYGDILRYFLDTLEIIFENKKANSFTENFSNSISFLQAIYIQQDFIEELLHIFKCQITKGDLKQDFNYQINRDIRNELVGHPIRKIKIQQETNNPVVCECCGKAFQKRKNIEVLSSSTIFSNSLNSKQINYIKYDRGNNYQSEEVTADKEDIIKRHSDFLVFYLDKITKRLKNILSEFNNKTIETIEGVMRNAPFLNILQVVEQTFTSISEYHYLFEPELLKRAYSLKDNHLRYKNAIDLFIEEMNQTIKDLKIDINDFINETGRYEKRKNKQHCDLPEIVITDSNEDIESSHKKDESCDYEMSKLIDKKDVRSFEFFSSSIIRVHKDNNMILNEIDNMKQNLNDSFEYYCSYYYLSKLLEGHYSNY